MKGKLNVTGTVENLKKTFTHDLKGMILRFLTSWIFVSFIYLTVSDYSFLDNEFYSSISFIFFVLITLLLWLFLCVLKNNRLISVILVASAVCYSVTAVKSQTDGFIFAVGCCIIVAGLILYSEADAVHIKIKAVTTWIAAGLMVVAFTAVLGWICCMYYKNFKTPCYDFGIFAQMYYNMKKTGAPVTTCERDKLLSHFAVHFSPIFYLLFPLYYIFPSPMTLLVAQCFITSGGIIPLVLICRKHKISEAATILLCLCYMLYPCFAGSCFWYFHENNFLTPLILWTLCFGERKKPLPTIIFAVLLLMVKEDAAVYLAIIAIYLLLSQKNFKTNLPLLGASIIYFFVVTYFMKKYGDGVMTSRYSNYMYDGSDSLVTVIKALIQNPVNAIFNCFTKEKLVFLLQMLLPLGFLPLMTKKPERLILVIPLILFNLMSDYQYQCDIGYQYCFGSGGLLIYLAAVNYSEMGESRKKVLLSAAGCSIIIFAALYTPKLTYYKTYKNQTETRETIAEALALVPDDASVTVSELLQPPLAQRDEVYKMETTVNQSEYYVLDLRLEENIPRIERFDTEQYETLFYEYGTIAVYKNLEYTPAN